MLRDWVLLRARLQQGAGLPFVVEGEGHEFYMLRCGAKNWFASSCSLCVLSCRTAPPPLALPDSGAAAMLLSPSRCSKRTKQHATPPEINAVRLACRNLLKAGAEPGGWRCCGGVAAPHSL